MGDVDEYIYLGQIVSFSNTQYKEVERRIDKAWKSIWSIKELMKAHYRLSGNSSANVYCPSQPTVRRTWSFMEIHKPKLKVCQKAMACTTFGVKKTDRVWNTTLYSKTHVAVVGKVAARLKWD